MRNQHWRGGAAGRGPRVVGLAFVAPLCLFAVASAERVGLSDAGGGVANVSAESKCCCRGPKPELCRLLPKEELHKATDMFNWKDWRPATKMKCPWDYGYHGPRQWGMLDVTPLPRCSGEEPVPAPGPVVRVRAYWMRHGWSCANALQQQGKVNFSGTKLEQSWGSFMNSKRFALYRDPSLTDLGIARAEKLGEPIRKRILAQTHGEKPLLFSSVMIRAMETAFYNFPGWDLHPIPFIAETGISLDNVPLPWEEQGKKLYEKPPNKMEQLRATKFDVAPKTHPDRASPLSKSSYAQFLNFLPGALEELLVTPPADGSEVPVVIVGHSGYMRKHLECGENGTLPKPRNNEVWVQEYTFQWGAWDARLESAGCRKLFASEAFPGPPEKLCLQDVKRCSSRSGHMRPNGWLERDEGFCAGVGDETIVERDAQEGLSYAQPGAELQDAKPPADEYPVKGDGNWLFSR